MSVIALATISGAAFAGDNDKVKCEDMGGAKVVVTTPDASSGDYDRARWAFYNADKWEVNRFKDMGFSEREFQAICNISIRSGLSTDYIARQIHDMGGPIAWVAAWDGVSPRVLGRDLPGFGATQIGIETAYNTQPMDTQMAFTGLDALNVTASSALPAASNDVIDVLSSDPAFSTFASALKVAGLNDTLRGAGPYTIFAPTNDAFAKLPSGTLDTWLQPENRAQLTAVLMYHIVPGKVKAADISAMANQSTETTLGGKTIAVTTVAPLKFGTATITRSDIDASNGEIHGIDTIQTPDMTGTAPLQPAPAPAPAPAQ
jgi:uncharacterized surface protein with fasciclin (FAS1) repeats